MTKISRLYVVITGILLLAWTSGCTTQSDNAALDGNTDSTAQAPSALPTALAGQNLHMAANRSCLLKEFMSVQIDAPQGNLLQWSPVEDKLAFVRSTNQSWSWFVGDLVIYTPEQETEEQISQAEAVFGDLTWSPDGSAIAYVILDQEEEIYTITLANLTNDTSLNVFGSSEAARTDEWSSRKGIREWAQPNRLMVTSACGTDCRRVYLFDTTNLSLTQQDEIRLSEDKSLTPDNESTSWNDEWSITTDEENNVWFSSSESSEAWLVLANTAVNEIKWSRSSSYFALHTRDRVLIYEPVCSSK